MHEQLALCAASAKEMSLVFSLRPLGSEIELLLEQYLTPAPTGIYSNTRLEPVMTAGNDYFEIQPDGTKTRVVDINKAKTAVYDANDKRVITAQQVKNMASCLSETPFLPYRGIKIARLLYEYAIDSRVRWRRSRSVAYDKVLRQHMTGVACYEDLEQLLDEFQIHVNQNIEPLIVDHEWHYFYLRDTGETNLRVERGIDYRVDYFMREFEAGNIKI